MQVVREKGGGFGLSEERTESPGEEGGGRELQVTGPNAPAVGREHFQSDMGSALMATAHQELASSAFITAHSIAGTPPSNLT